MNAETPFAPEGPQPLLREIAEGEPYPVASLGPLRPAVEAVQGMTLAPIAIPAQSALAVSIIGDGETLYSVKYFTAYATWHASGYARHREYVAALKEEGVTVYLGNFKEKFKDCPKCKASIKSHEEKETDVNIGIHLVADALQDRFDRAIIISADSDLCCAVNLAKELAPAKAIDVASPPGRHAHARELKPLFSVTKGKIRAARLEEIYTNQAGAVIAQAPDKYRV